MKSLEPLCYNKLNNQKEGVVMSELCLGCMAQNDGEDVCPNCGFDKHSEQLPPFLPLGTVLQEKYIVGRVLGSTTEYIKYIGFDQSVDSAVVIREYFPAGICTRTAASPDVIVMPDKKDIYDELMQDYLSLHRSVACFKELSAIIPVFDIFSENGTSYVIENHEEVIPFKEYIERSGGSLEWDTARPLFMPLLSALSKIHQKGLFHLGISPENLVIAPSGKMKIDNFSIAAARQNGKGIQAQLYSGSSAPEQYESSEKLDESTDIYGFTATLFYALTGKLPTDAQKRKEDGRLLISTSVVKRLPPHVITALANGLQVDRSVRIRDFETLRAQLSAAPTVKAIQEEIARPAVVPQTEGASGKKKLSNFSYGVIAAVVALIVFSVAGFFWVSSNPFQGMFLSSPSTSDPSDPSSPSDSSIPADYIYPKDSKYFRVPNFINKKFDDVVKEAENSDEYFILRTTNDEFSDTVPEGYICSQTPAGMTTVDRGNDGVTISVTVSKGPKQRELPKVEGLSLDKAAQTLADEGFVTNTVLEFSDTVEENKVIGYEKSFKEGQKLDYGSEVTIVVSLGEKPDLTSQGSASQ